MSYKKRLNFFILLAVFSGLSVTVVFTLFVNTVSSKKELETASFVSATYLRDLNEVLSTVSDDAIIKYENLESRKYLLSFAPIKELISNIDKTVYVFLKSKDKTNPVLQSLLARLPFWQEQVSSRIKQLQRNLEKSYVIYLITIFFSLAVLIFSIIMISYLHIIEARHYKKHYSKLKEGIRILESVLPDIVREHKIVKTHPQLKNIASFINVLKTEFVRELKNKDTVYQQEKHKITETLKHEKLGNIEKHSRLQKIDINNKFLSYILNTISFPILVVDEFGFISYVNRSFLVNFSLSYQGVIGENISALREYFKDKDLANIISSRIKTVMLSQEAVYYKDIKFVPLKGQNAKLFGISILFHKMGDANVRT